MCQPDADYGKHLRTKWPTESWADVGTEWRWIANL